MIMCARFVGLGRTCSNNAKLGSLQNPYHTSRFAPYVLFCVHRVANLRRSIRVYQTLRFHIKKARHNDEPFKAGAS